MATYHDNRAANADNGANVGIVIAVLLLALLAAWAFSQFLVSRTAVPATSTAGSTTSVTTGAPASLTGGAGTPVTTPSTSTTAPLVPSATTGAATR